MSQIPRDSFSPALIKPTYNVGDYGHDVIIPLNCLTGSATTTLTPSTATFVQVLDDGRVPVDEVNQFITDSDKMELIHAGNDTDYDTTFEWLPDMSIQAYKASFSVAVAMKVSAHTSGNFNIGNLIVTVTEQGASNRVIYTNTFASGAANLTGTGNSLHWFTADIVEAFQVFPNQPVKINLTLDTTLATGTSQAGIVSIAPYLKTAVLKSFNESVVALHVHAGLGHADDIFRFNMDRVKSEAFNG